jgi:tetratricopeptide (TPR) repeat protein
MITWGDGQEPQPKNTPELPDYSKVLAAYDLLINADPGFGLAYFNRGNVRCRIKDYNGAVQDYSEAIRSEPKMAEAYFNRGLTLIYLDEKSRACMDLSKAGELGLDNAYKVITKYCNK